MNFCPNKHCDFGSFLRFLEKIWTCRKYGSSQLNLSCFSESKALNPPLGNKITHLLKKNDGTPPNRKEHSVWKSQKKSHSTLRAKRATFTFWVEKSSSKLPKMVNFGDFSETWKCDFFGDFQPLCTYLYYMRSRETYVMLIHTLTTIQSFSKTFWRFCLSTPTVHTVLKDHFSSKIVFDSIFYRWVHTVFKNHRKSRI